MQSAKIEIEDKKNYLHIKVKKDSHLSLNHPQLRQHALPLTKGENYRFHFNLRGKEEAYSRHQPPVQIRISYLPSAQNNSKQIYYEWFRYRPSSKWQKKYIMVKSPNINKWSNAVVTIFFSREGKYDIGDIKVEPW